MLIRHFPGCLAQEDAVQMIDRCLSAPPTVRFGIFDAISENSTPLAGHNAGQGGPGLAARRDRRTGSTRPSSSADASPSVTALRAGFARRDITQPLGTPSSLGPVHGGDRGLGSADRDGSRARVGRHRGSRWSGSTCAGCWRPRIGRSARRSRPPPGSPPDDVVLNVSHSHSAPYVSADLQELLRPFGLRVHDDDYAAALQRGGRRGRRRGGRSRRTGPRSPSGAGASSASPATAGRSCRDGRTVHRYGRPPEELRALPEGLIDPEVAVVRFARGGRPSRRGDPVYACHPTAVGPRHPDASSRPTSSATAGPRSRRDFGVHVPVPAGLRRQPGHRQVGRRDRHGRTPWRWASGSPAAWRTRIALGAAGRR